MSFHLVNGYKGLFASFMDSVASIHSYLHSTSREVLNLT